MRNAGIALGAAGGLGQLLIVLMGYAIGGTSQAGLLLVLTLDAVVALAGVGLSIRWRMLGAGLMLLAGLGAVVALFSSTLLEIGVAALLLLAVAATLMAARVKQ